jgi:hypothetical protein
MKKIFYFILLMLFLFSCNNEKENELNNDYLNKIVKEESVIEDKIIVKEESVIEDKIIIKEEISIEELENINLENLDIYESIDSDDIVDETTQEDIDELIDILFDTN